MKNKIRKSLLFFFSLVISGCLLFAQQAGIKPVMLAENLYLIRGLGGNIVFLVTGDGVLVVDAGSMASHGKLVTAAVKEVTDNPIKYLVLTHYHYDHVNGSPGFPPGIRVIAHCRLEKNLEVNTKPLIEKLALPQFSIYLRDLENQVKKYESEKNPQLESARAQLEFLRRLVEEMKDFKSFKPDICFEEKMEILLGGETVQMFHPGSGHTDDGCLVYFPGKEVLHTGDLFVNRVCPFLDGLAKGDINSWIQILHDINGMAGVKTLIPGHGDPCGKEGVKQLANLLIELREQVEVTVKKNLTLEQVIEQIDLPSFKGLPASDLLKYDIEAVYNAIKKEQ